MVSLAETPLTGKPDAGNPPVRFGGRGSSNAALPTPIFRFRLRRSADIRSSGGINHTKTNSSMKTPPTAFLIGLAAVAISSAWAEDSEAIKKDKAQLQGEWSMVSGSADGNAMPDALRETAKRVCKGDETTVTVGEQLLMKAKFTLDPSRKPKTIDYQMIDGPTKGKKQLGIYELEGDTAKFCFGSPGSERPTDFTSKPGDGRTLSVWKRKKTSDPAQK